MLLQFPPNMVVYRIQVKLLAGHTFIKIWYSVENIMLFELFTLNIYANYVVVTSLHW